MNHEERPDISPAEILGQALALFKANWRTYFAWCLFPFLGVAAGLLSLMLREKLPFGLVASGFFLLLASSVLTIPLSIQIYRHALLGERPQSLLLARFFTGRTWGYIGNSIVIGLAQFLLGPGGLRGPVDRGVLGAHHHGPGDAERALDTVRQ